MHFQNLSFTLRFGAINKVKGAFGIINFLLQEIFEISLSCIWFLLIRVVLYPHKGFPSYLIKLFNIIITKCIYKYKISNIYLVYLVDLKCLIVIHQRWTILSIWKPPLNSISSFSGKHLWIAYIKVYYTFHLKENAMYTPKYIYTHTYALSSIKIFLSI